MTMNRREALAAMGGLTLTTLAEAPQAVLPPFWKSRLSDIDATLKEVRKGKVQTLAKSPGKRDVQLVAYGERNDFKSTANYNSACGAGDPAAYARKDGSQRPTVLFLGPVHGQEFEGIAGLVNLIRIAETGRDYRDREWKTMSAHLEKCRVLIIPCGNPDGRARCAYDSWVGEEMNVHERIGMGVRPDGKNYTWPDVKRFHPMRGAAVGTMGAYWNDDGVNLMHDEWFDAMAAETKAFFRIAREEAPDYIVSLHSHGSSPAVLETHHLPRLLKERLKELGDRVQKRYADAGLPHRPAGPAAVEDGLKFPPPSFNLTSALHFACGGLSYVHETCTGVKTAPFPQVGHDQLLDLQLLHYEELLATAVAGPVKWVK
jgi:hypothetical protein